MKIYIYNLGIDSYPVPTKTLLVMKIPSVAAPVLESILSINLDWFTRPSEKSAEYIAATSRVKPQTLMFPIVWSRCTAINVSSKLTVIKIP